MIGELSIQACPALQDECLPEQGPGLGEVQGLAGGGQSDHPQCEASQEGELRAGAILLPQGMDL